MALKTTRERLEQVQEQIENLSSGIASYTIGDVRITRANDQLKVLYDQERYLSAMYKRERNNVGRIRVNLSGRSR